MLLYRVRLPICVYVLDRLFKSRQRHSDEFHIASGLDDDGTHHTMVRLLNGRDESEGDCAQHTRYFRTRLKRDVLVLDTCIWLA